MVGQVYTASLFFFFSTRWTSAYGEEYDYSSIMHYSSRAFSKRPEDPSSATIVPRSDSNHRVSVSADDLGRRGNLSDADIRKVKRKNVATLNFVDYSVPPFFFSSKFCLDFGFFFSFKRALDIKSSVQTGNSEL